MSPSPRRLVLLGHPVAHSFSPAFQNAALFDAGIQLSYEALDVPPGVLGQTLVELANEEAAGNVTLPHKAAVAGICDSLQPAAVRTGAVNTFWIEDGALIGDNTDVAGFEALALALLGAAPHDAVIGILGAGGAAAAVLAAVERWPGCSALVHNRSPKRAVELCERFRSIASISDAAQLAARADIVVNATSIGLGDDAFPMDPALLRPGAAVLDLVYRHDDETAWVRATRASGHQAMDGLTMLIEQGAHAFERWFKRAPNREVMWEAVKRR